MAKTHRGKQGDIPPDQLLRKKERGEIEFHGRISKAKRPSRYEQDPYNEYQNFLYNRALFGLSVYPKEELETMHWDKKKRIIKVHKRAQTLVNLWKQEIVLALSNHLFTTIFPDSPITKELLGEELNGTDETYINKMSLKLLKISKEMVIERFIAEGILPKNFNELVPNQDASRDLNQRIRDNSSNESGKHIGARIAKVIS